MTTPLSRLKRIASAQARLQALAEARLAVATADQKAAVFEHQTAIDNASGGNPLIEATVAFRLRASARAYRHLAATTAAVSSHKAKSIDARRIGRQLESLLLAAATEAQRKVDLDLLSDLIERSGSSWKRSSKAPRKDGGI